MTNAVIEPAVSSGKLKRRRSTLRECRYGIPALLFRRSAAAEIMGTMLSGSRALPMLRWTGTL